MAWKLYEEINGVDGATSTTESSGTLSLIHRSDLSDNPQDSILYYAEIEEDTGDNGVYALQAESNPGTDPVVVTPADAAPGSGHETTEVTLALSAAALDTNTAGAGLTVSWATTYNGEALLSGVSNAVKIHVRVENAVTDVSNSTELSLDRNAAIQIIAATS